MYNVYVYNVYHIAGDNQMKTAAVHLNYKAYSDL